MRLTGTSSALPDSVRGTSAICKIWLGTCRGEQSSRMRRLISPSSAASNVTPSANTTNSTIHSCSSAPRALPPNAGVGMSTTSASATCSIAAVAR
jgi:hypothetical protein